MILKLADSLGLQLDVNLDSVVTRYNILQRKADVNLIFVFALGNSSFVARNVKYGYIRVWRCGPICASPLLPLFQERTKFRHWRFTTPRHFFTLRSRLVLRIMPCARFARYGEKIKISANSRLVM